MSSSRRSSRSLVTLVVALVVLLAAPVAAQEETTTTTTTTTSTSAPPASTTSTTAASTTSAPPQTTSSVPGDGTTTTTAPGASPESTTSTTAFDPDAEPAPGEDPVADETEIPPEEVPTVEDTIPPPEGEPVDAQEAERLIRRELQVARADLVASEADVDAAAQRVDELGDRLARLQKDLARLDIAQQQAVQALEEARLRFEERVANAVVRGNAAELDTVLTSESANEIETRKMFLETVSEADRQAVADFQAAKAVIDTAVLEAIDAVAETRRELRDARFELRDALRRNTEHRFQLAVFAAGSEIVIRGFVFPVEAPYTFIDSWGFPRMTGTEYEHGHQGTDIMAPFGASLYAVERGIVIRIGTDVLGGTKLWVKGRSGTYYYYAHLSAYAEGVTEGMVVDAGDVIGFVGDTGNAKGGAPHLHFQVHPGGGAPVNPYGLLRVVADLSRR